MKKIALALAALLLLSGCAGNPSVNPQDTSVPGVTAEPTPAPTEAPTPVVNESPAPDRSAVTTPVLIEGLLVGGLVRGEWVPWKDFYNGGAVDFDGYRYGVYRDDTYMGEATGGPLVSFLTGGPLADREDLSDLTNVYLYDDTGKQVPYNIAIQGDWDLYPRAYTAGSTERPEYQALVEDQLTQAGLTDPDTTLKQVINVDLDGDGSEETLIAADNSIDYQYPKVKKGDNSLLMFRRTVNGAPADQLIDSYVLTEDPEYPTPYRLFFEVKTCADLDGDGCLEVVVRSWYYEGVSFSVYKLEGDQLVKVAENGVGV